MLLEEMSKEQLLKLCKDWEQAHCQPGVHLIGSEFYANPKSVFAIVKEKFAELRELKMEKARARIETGKAKDKAPEDAFKSSYQDYT